MRKHVWALLSVLGVAGSVVPSQGQILKGKQADKENTANASTIKIAKSKREQAADSRFNKIEKNRSEEHASWTAMEQKSAKAGGEKTTPNAASQMKWGKSAAETNAAQKAGQIKVSKQVMGSKAK